MAGKMKNCAGCGKIFVALEGKKFCPDCMEQEYKLEEKVVNYVRDNPKSSVTEILKEIPEASEKLIKRLIREGRFEQVGVKMSYPCEKCGAPIVTGKLCGKCSDALRNELQATQLKAVAVKKPDEPSKQRGRGMYTVNH